MSTRKIKKDSALLPAAPWQLSNNYSGYLTRLRI